MEKPKLKKRKDVMDYHEMIDFIEKKHNIRVRGYGINLYEDNFGKYQRVCNDPMPFGDGVYPDVSGNYMEDWEQEEGYEGWTITRNGEKIKATKEQYDADFKLIHEQYQRYQVWTIDNPEPPYLDYWHWILDNWGGEFSDGCVKWLGVLDILDGDNTPEWVLEITQLIHDEFKEYLDEEGGIDVLIEW